MAFQTGAVKPGWRVDKVLKAMSKLFPDSPAMERTSKHHENLGKNQNLSLQYQRRDSVEIAGIPEDIADANLVEEVKRCDGKLILQQKLKK